MSELLRGSIIARLHMLLYSDCVQTKLTCKFYQEIEIRMVVLRERKNLCSRVLARLSLLLLYFDQARLVFGLSFLPHPAKLVLRPNREYVMFGQVFVRRLLPVLIRHETRVNTYALPTYAISYRKAPFSKATGILQPQLNTAGRASKELLTAFLQC